MDTLGKIFALIWFIIATIYSYEFYKFSISAKRNRIKYSVLGFIIGIVCLLTIILTISAFEQYILVKLFNYSIIDFKDKTNRCISVVISIVVSITVLLIFKNIFFKKIIARLPTDEIDEIGS